MRDVGTVGKWKFQHHRMARFEDGKLFTYVASVDDEGSLWNWMVMLPERDPDKRTRGEAGSALEAVRAVDAVAGDVIGDGVEEAAVQEWAAKHLKWRAELDRAETEATQKWGD